MSDRVTAALLLLLALWFGYEAWGFRATFFTDPVGARAVPLAIALFLVPLALFLLLRAQKSAKWPPRHVWPVLAVGFITFVLYAYLLEPLGFMLATTLFFVVFGRLFAAKLWQGAVAGIGFSVVLYMVFVWGLDLYLPVGDLFARFF